jgi:hypothetical protein
MSPGKTLDLGPTADDWAGAFASPETYQAAVRRLTGELRDCRDQLAAEQQARKRETTQLRAQLREGLTPEIVELRKSVSSWRTRAQAAEARLREARWTGVAR